MILSKMLIECMKSHRILIFIIGGNFLSVAIAILLKRLLLRRKIKDQTVEENKCLNSICNNPQEGNFGKTQIMKDRLFQQWANAIVTKYRREHNFEESDEHNEDLNYFLKAMKQIRFHTDDSIDLSEKWIKDKIEEQLELMVDSLNNSRTNKRMMDEFAKQSAKIRLNGEERVEGKGFELDASRRQERMGNDYSKFVKEDEPIMIKSKEHWIFLLEISALKVSGYIQNMLEDLGADMVNLTNLPNEPLELDFEGNLLSKIIKWCNYQGLKGEGNVHSGIKITSYAGQCMVADGVQLSLEYDEWEFRFIAEIEENMLFPLAELANKMKISFLHRAITQRLGNYLYDMEMNDVNRVFGSRNDAHKSDKLIQRPAQDEQNLLKKPVERYKMVLDILEKRSTITSQMPIECFPFRITFASVEPTQPNFRENFADAGGNNPESTGNPDSLDNPRAESAAANTMEETTNATIEIFNGPEFKHSNLIHVPSVVPYHLDEPVDQVIERFNRNMEINEAFKRIVNK